MSAVELPIHNFSQRLDHINTFCRVGILPIDCLALLLQSEDELRIGYCCIGRAPSDAFWQEYILHTHYHVVMIFQTVVPQLYSQQLHLRL